MSPVLVRKTLFHDGRKEELNIKRPVVRISAAFVLGEVIACLWRIHRDGSRSDAPAFALLLFFFALLLLLAAVPLRKAAADKKIGKAGGKFPGDGNLRLFLFVLLLSFTAGGSAGFRGAAETPAELFLEESGETCFCEAGGALESVSEKNGRVTLFLSGAVIKTGSRVFKEKLLLVRAEEFPEEEYAEYGDGIHIAGKLLLPEKATNPGQFDYRNYCRGLGVRITVKASEVSADSRFNAEEVSPGKQLAKRVKRKAEKLLPSVFPAEEEGFFRAVLLGDRAMLSEETGNLFRDAGISHILAVSGLHVSVIGMSLFHALRKLGAGYGTAGAAASGVLVFYGFLTGFGSSVFRAVLMTAMSFAAAWLGRTFDMQTALALGLVLLGAENPFCLFAPGTQLSFGAVFVIARVLESHRELFRKNPRPASLLMGIAIPLGTLPLVLRQSFQFPVYGFFLNLLVLPLMPWTAASGFLALGLLFLKGGFLSAGQASGALLIGKAARFAAGSGYYLYHLFRLLGEISEKLPGHLLIGGKPGMVVSIIYFAAFFFLFSGTAKDRRRLLFRIFLYVFSFILLTAHPKRGLTAAFLDVRQGDGAVIFCDGKVFVSDCGSSQRKDPGLSVLVPYLKSEGVRRVDRVFVSHSDSDHTGGIRELLIKTPEIAVGELWLPLTAKDKEEYAELRSASLARGIPVKYSGRGFHSEEGRMKITFLNPPGTGTLREDPNSDSLVFVLEYGKCRFLFTGDIGAEEEEEILQNCGVPDIAVLKAAHHGSAGSGTEEFLREASPEAAVISCGAGNPYGHPAEETLERLENTGARIFRTDRDGAVIFRTDGEKLWVRTFRE